MERDRLVPLQGTLNFRDLGGYPARGGRTVRWGLVYRSDALHELTENDLETIRGLRLRAVYDLRKSTERQKQPTAIPEDQGHRAVHLVIGDDPTEDQPEVLDLILAGEMIEADDNFVADLYIRMLEEAGPTFGRLLTHLTEDDGLPALFHCAAGKDRTGIAAALLLSVLGVDENVILDDYELSTKYRSERRIEVLRPQIEAAGVDVEKVRPFLSARRPVMETTLRHLNATYGSVEDYLTTSAEMTEATLDRLRALLLD